MGVLPRTRRMGGETLRQHKRRDSLVLAPPPKRRLFGLSFFGDSCRIAEANWGEPTQTPMGERRKAKPFFTPILLRVLCGGLRRRPSGRVVASSHQLWPVWLEDQPKQRKSLRCATAAVRSRGLGAKERAWREEERENQRRDLIRQQENMGHLQSGRTPMNLRNFPICSDRSRRRHPAPIRSGTCPINVDSFPSSSHRWFCSNAPPSLRHGGCVGGATTLTAFKRGGEREGKEAQNLSIFHGAFEKVSFRTCRHGAPDEGGRWGARPATACFRLGPQLRSLFRLSCASMSGSSCVIASSFPAILFGGSTIMTPSHDTSDSGKKAIRGLEDASRHVIVPPEKMVLLRRSQREAGPSRGCCDELSFSLLA